MTPSELKLEDLKKNYLQLEELADLQSSRILTMQAILETLHQRLTILEKGFHNDGK